MTWILTHSGQQFDLLRPTAGMIKPLDIAHALSNLCRFNGHTRTHYSVAQHSLIATNAYANGRQSIHGMSSVLAGIPSLKDAFTSSPYSNQKIQSIVSVSNEMGYDTSFFHAY